MKTNLLRRQLFLSGAMLSVAPHISFAQEKLVYQNWTQTQLNDQFSQTPYLTNVPQIIESYTTNSVAVRKEFPPRTFNYGTGPDENLDAFIPVGAKTLPIMIFIHGGGWTEGTNQYFSAPAATFVRANAIYVAINFTNTPPNSIPGMTKQCREAIKWVWKNAAMLGGDANQLYVSGHSSGGHLANMMLTTSWVEHGLPAKALKGGVIMSGWTDLYPVSLSDRQKYLKLDKKQIADYSPINRIDKVQVPIIISWGALESPYMQEQSAAWAKKLQSVGKLAGVYRVPNKNHYEMPNQLNSAGTLLAQATLALMDLVNK